MITTEEAKSINKENLMSFIVRKISSPGVKTVPYMFSVENYSGKMKDCVKSPIAKPAAVIKKPGLFRPGRVPFSMAVLV